MSNKFLVLGVLIASALTLGAQSFKPESYLGINGGMNASMVWFKPTISQTYQIGKNAGLTFRYISEKNLGLQVELNFIEKGWNENNGLIDIYNRRLSYLVLPFLTHIYFGNKARFYFELGPQLSYLLKDEVGTNYYLDPSNVEQAQALDNQIDYGGAAGLGMYFKIGSQAYQLGARASYSLNDIFSNNKVDYFDRSNNIAVQANLSWLIQTNYKRK